MVKSQPNILFIFTDQFRADCIHALGNEQIRTPNIDRLVREGTTFTNCYSPSPVCMPARHALTCGEPPHRTGCVDNLDIDCTRPSFMESLNQLGYQTHGVGKMHFVRSKGDWGFQSRDIAEELEGDAARDDYRSYLAEQGFDHVTDPYGFRSEFYYLPQPSQLPDRVHNNAWVADRSIAFLQNRDASRPYFLWSSFIKPHPPFETPVPWSRLFRMHEMDSPHLPENYEEHRNFWSAVQARYKYLDSGYSENLAKMIRAAYYNTIAHLDHHVGRILDALGDDIDNTLIVFSADHGEMLGDYGCYGKRSMMDASARVPMIARLPAAYGAGEQCSTPASLLDLFPSFVETAGGSIASGTEGTSLHRLYQGEQASRTVFSQFSQNRLGLYMAADASWKYIYSAADDKEWLYHDHNEDVNLAGNPDAADKRDEMRGRCIQRFQHDGYVLPLRGDTWQKFPATTLSAHPNEGLLFQDPSGLDQSIRDLGESYAPGGIDKNDAKYNLLAKLGQLSKTPYHAAMESSAHSAP